MPSPEHASSGREPEFPDRHGCLPALLAVYHEGRRRVNLLMLERSLANDPDYQTYLKSPDFNPEDIEGSRERCQTFYFSLFSPNERETEEVKETWNLISAAFDAYGDPERVSQIKEQLLYGLAAFLTHERGHEINGKGFADVANAFPALKNISPKKVAILFKQLPSVFWIGGYYPSGEVDTSRPPDRSIFAINATIQGMIWEAVTAIANGKDPSQSRKDYLTPRILDAVAKCHDWGASIIGLAQTMGSSTDHARDVEAFIVERYGQDARYPDRPVVTTGHAFTVLALEAAIVNATRMILDKVTVLKDDLKDDLRNHVITIAGGLGAIGEAVAELVVRMGFGGVVIHDLANKAEREEPLRQKLKAIDEAVNIRFRLSKTGKQAKKDLLAACQGSTILVTAASVKKAVYRLGRGAKKALAVLKDVFVVEDSQPPVLAESFVGLGVACAHVLMPASDRRTFDTGTQKGEDGHEQAHWSCEREVAALAELAKRGEDPREWATVGPVTCDHVDRVREKAADIGFLDLEYQNWPMQAFGREVPRNAIVQLRKIIRMKKAA